MAESIPVMKALTGSYSISDGGFVQVPIGHIEVDNGLIYNITRSTTVLGASSSIEMQLNTGSSATLTRLEHLDINNSAGLAQVSIIELTTASTMATGSSSIIAYNKNRNSTNTITGAVFGDPTLISSTNTFIFDQYFGSTGTNAIRGEGLDSVEEQYILKSNSTYIIRMTNLSGSAGYASFKVLISEQTPST
jgi:hypothetical protein